MKNKIINALSYLSITFAPLLFPLIVWIFAGDEDLTHHAKRAFGLHLLPVVLTVIALIVIGATGLTTNDIFSTGAVSALLFSVVGLIDLICYIYNLVYGIKILVS
ncbi:DUF4870 domain-containing protein [Paucilactobacillus sp. N302-9]